MCRASISAHHVNFPQPQAAYNVSKIGVSHLTRNIAVEQAVYGICVNCVNPGHMDTVLNAGDNLKDVRDMWASCCPMGRIGDEEEAPQCYFEVRVQKLYYENRFTSRRRRHLFLVVCLPPFWEQRHPVMPTLTRFTQVAYHRTIGQPTMKGMVNLQLSNC